VPILNLLYISCDCISIYRSRKAYYIEDAESFVYRRRSDDGEIWKVILKGLLEPSGTTITTLALNPKAAGANSILSTIMEYLSPMLQVFRGQDVTSNGQKNMHIYYILQ
jgi:hypothetical protein